MKPRILESTIERSARDYAESRGCLLLKLDTRSSAGWPDRVLLCPNGKASFIEFKQQGKKPRLLQQLRHESLRGLGFKVVVIDNSNTARVYVNQELSKS